MMSISCRRLPRNLSRVTTVKRTILSAALSVILFGLSATAQDKPQPVTPAELATVQLSAGEHLLSLEVDQQTRTANIHVPKSYDPGKPTPLVLALHGAAMNGYAMAQFCGMNQASDENGFVVVYPNGTGAGRFLSWNAGVFADGVGSKADDLAFFRMLLDDLKRLLNIDKQRVYVCGMSNGAMMTYRLASELSDRIAAIAAVGGTMAIGTEAPARPVPLIHFHGTSDPLVPYGTMQTEFPFWLKIRSVDQTINAWLKFNGCDSERNVTDVLSKDGDKLIVTRQTFGPGRNQSEVVLVKIDGGGHTWPGQHPPFDFLGKSVLHLSANDLIWNFFKKHPLK